MRTCYLVKESLRELLETLSTNEALLVVKFPVAVHDLLRRGEAALTALAHGVGQGVGHVAAEGRKKQWGWKIPEFIQIKLKKN